MKPSLLIERIAKVFPSESPPLKEKVLYEGAYRNDPELEEIKEFFGGRTWNSIIPRDVFRFRHALSFFSPSAFAYYSPAWMTCSLVDEDAVDTAIANLVGTLGESNPSLWIHEQRQIICEWLIHFKEAPLKENFEKAAANFGCKWCEPE